jgi:hypothetical protein
MWPVYTEQKRGEPRLPSLGKAGRLELHASGELHLTWVSCIARPRSARNVSGTLDVAARKAKVDVVERVERIGSELECDPLFDRKVLHEKFFKADISTL